FGLLAAAFAVGFIAGPAIGGVLAEVDPRAPAFAATGRRDARWSSHVAARVADDSCPCRWRCSRPAQPILEPAQPVAASTPARSADSDVPCWAGVLRATDQFPTVRERSLRIRPD